MDEDLVDELSDKIENALIYEIRCINRARIKERRHGYKRKQAVLPGINPKILPENNVPMWAQNNYK